MLPQSQTDTIIRLAQIKDVPAITAIYTPFVRNTAISLEFVPPTDEEMGERLRKTLAQFPWLVAEYNGKVIGYAYAGRHSERLGYQWAVDVSVYVHEPWHGKGVGRTLYSALFAVLRSQGYYRVYAGVTLPNLGSVALHQAMGMSSVGVYHQVGYKFAAWHDVGWWQGELATPIENPQPPRAFTALVNSEQWPLMMSAGVHFLRLPVMNSASQ